MSCMLMYRTYTGGYTIRTGTSINIEHNTRDSLKARLTKAETYDEGLKRILAELDELNDRVEALHADLVKCEESRTK